MYKLNVDLKTVNYPIYIERGILKTLGDEIKKIYNNKKIAVVTDSIVEKLYADNVKETLEKSGFEVKVISFEAGEESKNVNTLLKVYDELLNFEIHRGNLIIALGGGVVGDLCGFAAATLFRGIPFVQIPTTILAQVDSSVGGKVAVDLKRGKNLIGNFYHPKAVFIDPDVLDTLSDKILSDGMAEVIKYGAIKDKDLFDSLMGFKNREELFKNIEKVIYTCCSIKKDVVEKDEKDTGERMLLNFGHTIGHAIEKIYNYKTYTHGEGVAIGMYAMTEYSEREGITEKGTTEKIRNILIKYNLPYEMPKVNRDDMLKAIKLDKKNIGRNMHIILLKRIGESFVKEISKEDFI